MLNTETINDLYIAEFSFHIKHSFLQRQRLAFSTFLLFPLKTVPLLLKLTTITLSSCVLAGPEAERDSRTNHTCITSCCPCPRSYRVQSCNTSICKWSHCSSRSCCGEAGHTIGRGCCFRRRRCSTRRATAASCSGGGSYEVPGRDYCALRIPP